MNAHVNYDVACTASLGWYAQTWGELIIIIIIFIRLFPDLPNHVICFKQAAQFNKLLSTELLERSENTEFVNYFIHGHRGREHRQHRAGN